MYSVYVFLDGQNRPYYVGKTNNMRRRRREHLDEIKRGNKLPKYNKARQLIKKGVSLKMRAIRTTKSEKEAFKLERYFIKKYRADGYILMNCTAGGPLEKPIRINRPVVLNTKGIKLPKTKKVNKVKTSKSIVSWKVVGKKGRKISKKRRKR